MSTTKTNKNIALVLSGGGAKGIAHIGVINELERQGYNITSIAGTSMGALVGGIYAAGELKKFQDWMCSLTKEYVIKLVDLSFFGKGLIKGNRVLDKIKEIIPERNIEDLSIPFCAVATDILNGKEVHFTQGKLFGAIRASISIPTILIPHKLGDIYHVDGGLLNNIPSDCVKRNKDDILVVVNVTANIPVIDKKPKKDIKIVQENNEKSSIFSDIKHKVNDVIPDLTNKVSSIIPHFYSKDEISYLKLMDKSINLMMDKISQLKLEQYPPDILIEIPRDSYQIYEFYKAEEIIQLGEEVTRRTLNFDS